MQRIGRIDEGNKSDTKTDTATPWNECDAASDLPLTTWNGTGLPHLGALQQQTLAVANGPNPQSFIDDQHHTPQ